MHFPATRCGRVVDAGGRASQKKMRVFPMFFSCVLFRSAMRDAIGGGRWAASMPVAADACAGRDEKKLRPGVDTLKNRD